MKSLLKRSLAALLAMCMIVGLIPASVISVFAQNTQAVFYGDADADGDVDLQDVYVIENYIQDNTTTLDKERADVNADAAVDATDVNLIREYLVGNLDTLTPVLVTITFNTNGGEEIPSIQVGKGYTYKGEIPNAAKADATFVNWETGGSVFYQDSMVIEGDMTLNAVYEALPSKQELTIDSFSVDDQMPSYEVKIVSKSDAYNTVAEVESGISLLAKDGSEPVVTAVTDNGDGTFTVYAPAGFLEGATYELTLPEGLSFEGKDDMFRKNYFTIEKTSVDDIEFNSDVIFIKDTDEMKYTINGVTTDVLEAALLSNDEDAENIKGTFTMSHTKLKKDDIVCIYQKQHPDQRDYTKYDYEDDALAYVRITSVSGNKYGFENINEEDADEVLAMPDTIIYNVEELPTQDGTVSKDDYDAYARTKLDQEGVPEFKVDDFLVFYMGDFDSIIDENSTQADVVYGQITKVEGNEVSYTIISKEDVENFMGMYVSQDVDGQELIAEIDQEEVLKNVEEQAESSGFAERAANKMVSSALETGEVQSQLEEQGVSDTEIKRIQKQATNLASTGAGTGSGGKTTFNVGVPIVEAEFISSDRFENGIGIGLEITLILSVETKVNSKMSTLEIALSAGFEQEVALGFDVSVEDRWEWYAFVPVLEDLDVNVSMDLQNYTYISLGAKIYTISDDISKKKWKAYQHEYFDIAPMEVKNAIRELNKLGPKIKKYGKYADKVQELLEQAEVYKAMIPKVTVDGKEYSIDQIEESLDTIDAGASFEEIFNADDQGEYKTGVNALMEKYQDMLKQECDWVQLFEQTVVSHEWHIKVVAIKLSVDLVVNGNVNAAIGADVEYQMGKRYMFWLHILDKESGSSEIDLNDERFGFQLYVMGTLGIRAGVKVDISFGLISTSFASIGGNIEFGPYIKIWGYFLYCFEKLRPAGSQSWDENEEFMGAVYLELGVYLAVRFKAQVFENTFKYEPTLYEGEFPLMKKGERINVYDFVLQPTDRDVLYIKDSDNNSLNGAIMALPEAYMLMKRIDLRTGEMSQVAYPREKFNISFSNSDFYLNGNNEICVKKQGEGRFYETADMRIVWKSDKLAFSAFDVDITIPLVWTNYSEEEISERFTASVAVGNATDGYTTVWSKQYSRMDVFDLPTQDKILDLINYDDYETESGNIKYSTISGYTESSTDLNLTGDKTYYFNIDKKHYELTVNGVHKPDGSTESRTFTATYGEAFDLSSLKNTGKNNNVTNEYTSFKNVTDENGNVLDSNITADIFFVTKFGGTKGNVTANYNDDALTATFEFTGIGAVDDITVKFKRGSIPSTDDLRDYVEQQGGNNAYIESITPEIAPSNYSLTYTVNCIVKEVKKYNLSFNSNSLSSYKTRQFVEGSSANMYRPTDPEKEGYTFAGWYSDSALTKAFDFNTKLPANDITLYGKWTANEYEVSFSSSFSNGDNSLSAKVVTYGTTYGELPSLTSTDYRLDGWYTESGGQGTKITANSVFNVADKQTLYAYWVEKTTVDVSWFVDTKNSKNFNESNQVYTYTIEPAEHQAVKTGMVIYYRKQNTSTWTTEAPINAGTYDIKLTRPTCEYYKAFPEHFIEGGLVINKVSMGVLAAPQVFTNGYGAISASLPSNIKGDGVVSYILCKENKENGGYDTVKSNSFGLFSGIDGGDSDKYAIKISVKEGTNYYSAESKLSTGVVIGSADNLGYTVQFVFSTTDGTDSDISGYIVKGTQNLGDVKFDTPNYNDFEKGDVDAYTVATNISPWTITKAGVKKGKNIGIRPAWSFTSQIKVVKGSKEVSCDFLSGTEWGANVEDYKSDRFFRRVITSYGNFKPDNYRYISLSDTSDWTYTYNGNVTDQFGYYNIFRYENAPNFYIKSLYPEHQQFVERTGFTSYTIDRKGLVDYIKKYGGNEPQFYIYLSLDNSVGLGNASNYLHREILYCSNIPSKVTNSVSTVSTSSTVRSTAKAKASVGSSSANTLTEGNAFVISANDLKANVGDTVDVPVKIDTNKGIWGTLASVNYDNEALELQGYTLGSAFNEDSFTATKDLTGDSFKLLMTNSGFENSTATGDFVTLRFKVTEKATEPYYPITLDIVQTIDANGEVLQSDGKNFRINLDDEAPVISGVENGGTYYGDTAVTVSDSFLDKLTVDGQDVTLTDNSYTITADNKEHTIVATDKSGNSVEYKITVYKIYTVTFMDNDKVCATLNVNHNTAIGQLPAVPAKDGYDQVAPYWTIDGEKVTEETVIASDMTAIPVYTINKYSVDIPTEQIGYTLSVDKNEVEWKGSAKLTFKLADGYSKVDDFAVKVNGKVVEFTNDEYTISDIKENITVTVEGVEDITAPTAEITLGTNTWNEFLNTITFGLFFKETQSVTITANDVNTGSGINKIYYYLASEQITEDELKAVTEWQEYTGEFSINPDNQYVIYVKVVDNAGNTAYINSDGIVLDNTTPAISGVENGSTYYGDTVVTVTDGSLDKLTVDGQDVTLTDDSYTITADNNEHTIVATDKSGNSVEYKITVYKIYTVTFMDDDKVCATLNVNHSTEIGKLPAVPAKDGYDQVAPYWTIDGEKVTEETVITSDVTIVPVYTINKYSVQIPAGQKGYVLSVDKNEVEWKESAKLTFKLADGYSKADDFAVKVNGKTVELKNGEYTISDIKENITVTVEGVISNIKSPLTGDVTPVQTENPLILFGLLLILAVATVSMIYFTRKKEK